MAMMTSDTCRELKRRGRSKSPSPTKSNASKSNSSSPSWTQKLFNADTSTELPPGWKEYRDKSTGQIYYAKKSTGESSWERPKLSKQDKKELKKQRSDLNVKRGRSTSTKTSESPSQFSIEYTKEVAEVQKTVSFSNKDQIRTYRVESVGRKSVSPSKKFKKVSKSISKKPVKKSSPTKQRQGSPSKERKAPAKSQKDTDVKPTSKSNSSTQKSFFVPFKLGWRKKRKDKVVVKEPSPKEKSAPAAPSSLLGIRNKSLKKNAKPQEQQVPAQESKTTTIMSKVASLPTESSPARSTSEAPDVETSLSTPSRTPSMFTKLSSLPKPSTKSTETTSSKSEEASPQKAEKQIIDKSSSTSTSKPTSKIVNLLKPAAKSQASKPDLPKPSKSDEANNSSKSVEENNELKSSPDAPSDVPAAVPGELASEEKHETTENLAAPSGESGITKLKALTIALLGSNELSKQASGTEKNEELTEPIVSTPPRRTVSESKNGPPASSTLASSLPFTELMFDKNLEVDSDSVQMKETKPEVTPTKQEKEKDNKSEGISPSKIVNSLFKKNRSKESNEEEAALESTSVVPLSEPAVVTLPKAEVVSLDTVAKEEPVNSKATDGDTHTTGSSASGIGAEADPLESGWVVEDEDDLGVDMKEIKESRCGDCGCSQSMHESLLFFGGIIYKVVGKPNDDLRATMEDAGDFFADEDSQDGSEY